MAVHTESEETTEARILRAVGQPVVYTCPERVLQGILKCRSVTVSGSAPGSVTYWDVVDQIEFDGEPESWIRIGYYREVGDKLRWASQTTITEPASIWKRILLTAGREQPWFRELLEDVMKDLSRPAPHS